MQAVESEIPKPRAQY
uniref:Uncharacterized protein n=1 Tax=Arundo donax TaxID=35708 RepID=A0A0A8Z5W3_ARUDO